MKIVFYKGFVLKSPHRGVWKFGPANSPILEHSAASLGKAKKAILSIIAYCRA